MPQAMSIKSSLTYLTFYTLLLPKFTKLLPSGVALNYPELLGKYSIVGESKLS